VFNPRSSLDDAGNTIELSARFCGLDYPECTKDDWKPAGLECAGVTPVENQNCTSTEMAEYGIAIGLPSVFWIAFGITFMVLNALWYLLRCCKLFGGMKAGKGCCCMKYYSEAKAQAGDADNGEAPGYVIEPKCNGQLGVFRAWFGLMFLLIFIAALIGGVGNSHVGTGIDDSIEILFFDMKVMLYRVDDLMASMSAITEGTDAEEALSEIVDEGRRQIQCLDNDIKTMEADLNEAKDSALDMRSLVTTVVISIPLVISVVYVVSMFLKIKFLACCSNVWAWVLLLIVCLSAALHGTLAFLFADICYEFDLHLATYYLPESPDFDGYENLNFLPPEASKFCGPDGSLAFMKDQFDAQLDASIQMAFDAVEEQCNDVLMAPFMDCEAVSVLDPCSVDCDAVDDAGDPYVKRYRAKTVACEEDAEDEDDCGWGFWNAQLATVPTTLMIRNADADNMPREIVSCLALRGEACSHPVTYAAIIEDPACAAAILDGNPLTCEGAGSCQYFAAGDDPESCAPEEEVNVIADRAAECVTACTSAADGTDCTNAAYQEPTTIEPTDDDIVTCFDNNEPCGGTCGWLTFEECATECTSAEARENSAAVVDAISESTEMVEDLRELLDEKATPLLKCSFVSEMFADLFVPLCVDAFGGFSLISGANVVSIIALIISFPVGVMATKRLVKTKVMPEATYVGATGEENATANTGPPANETNDPTVVETTQLM